MKRWIALALQYLRKRLFNRDHVFLIPRIARITWTNLLILADVHVDTSWKIMVSEYEVVFHSKHDVMIIPK